MPKGFKGFQKGKLNPMWKKGDVGYAAIHEWVKRYLPKPKMCLKCKAKRKLDLANISNNYKRDLTDWEWLCRRCHMSKDGRKEKLIERNKTGKHRIIFFSEDKNMIKLFQKIASKRERNEQGRFCGGWSKGKHKQLTFIR